MEMEFIVKVEREKVERRLVGGAYNSSSYGTGAAGIFGMGGMGSAGVSDNARRGGSGRRWMVWGIPEELQEAVAVVVLDMY